MFPSSDRLADNASAGNTSYDLPTPMASQQQLSGGQIFHVRGQQTAGYHMGRGQSPVAFSMSGMAGALPEYPTTNPSQISHQDSQRFIAGTASGPSNYQAQQFPNQAPLSTGSFPLHPSQYPYQPTYGQTRASPQSSHLAGPNPVQSPYPGGAYYPASQQQPYMYYPGQYVQPPQPQHGSYPTAYGSAPSHAYGQQGGDMSAVAGRTMHSGYSAGTVMPYPSYGSPGTYMRPGSLPSK